MSQSVFVLVGVGRKNERNNFSYSPVWPRRTVRPTTPSSRLYSVFHRRKRGRFFLRPLYDGWCPALAPWTKPPLAGVFQLVHKIMHSQQPGDEEEKIQNHGGPRKGGVLHPLSLHGGGGVQFSRFGLLDG